MNELLSGGFIRLRNVDHHAYLGMCGGADSSCPESSTGVLGYSQKIPRTRWQVEQVGGSIYIKQPEHHSYLGMCGGDTSCTESSYGVMGFPSKSGRTRWQAEKVGNHIYLKQPEHHSYLGMCGADNSCDGSVYGVLGFPSKLPRTRWDFERVSQAELEAEEASTLFQYTASVPSSAADKARLDLLVSAPFGSFGSDIELATAYSRPFMAFPCSLHLLFRMRISHRSKNMRTRRQPCPTMRTLHEPELTFLW